MLESLEREAYGLERVRLSIELICGGFLSALIGINVDCFVIDLITLLNASF